MFIMATARKIVHLSINKKVKVIKYAAGHPGVGVGAIGEQFKVKLKSLINYIEE